MVIIGVTVLFDGFGAGLSAGSRMFDGVPSIGFDVVSARHPPHITHITYRRA